MALRKASSYSKKPNRPYTRKSSDKSKAYIKTVPFSKIVKFSAGDASGLKDKKHTFIVKLIADEGVLIRDNALESGRMLLHKMLEEEVPGQYFLSVRVYPHHFLRENKVATGAGADRMKCGMTESFGIVIGRAALVRAGQDIFFVSCKDEKAARIARNALTSIKAKVPCRTRIVFEKVD